MRLALVTVSFYNNRTVTKAVLDIQFGSYSVGVVDYLVLCLVMAHEISSFHISMPIDVLVQVCLVAILWYHK